MSWGTFLIGAGLVLGMVTVMADASQEVKPIPVVAPKLAALPKGDECLGPDEVGEVLSVKVSTYAEPTKELPKGTKDVTYITFVVPDRYSRVCQWDYVDLTGTVQIGSHIANLKSGKRVL